MRTAGDSVSTTTAARSRPHGPDPSTRPHGRAGVPRRGARSRSPPRLYHQPSGPARSVALRPRAAPHPRPASGTNTRSSMAKSGAAVRNSPETRHSCAIAQPSVPSAPPRAFPPSGILLRRESVNSRCNSRRGLSNAYPNLPNLPGLPDPLALRDSPGLGDAPDLPDLPDLPDPPDLRDPAGLRDPPDLRALTRRRRDRFRPHQHLGPAAVGLVEDQAGASALEVFQGEVHAIGIEIDPAVVQERHVPRRRHPEQPERNGHAHELSRVLVVGHHAQRVELPGGERGWDDFAMQHGLVVSSNLDERLLTGETRTRFRELLLRVVARRELRVDVAVDEEHRAAD